LRSRNSWPTRARDYKPLVDFAIAHEWPVVAANVPRDIAADVARSGLDVLKTLPDSHKAWIAKDLDCDPSGDYFRRFREAMTGTHETAGAPMTGPTLDRFYASQCLKDETMAESIAQSYTAGALGGTRPLVVSINGAFHSDYGEGNVERTRRRLPGRSIVVVSIRPVADLDTLDPDADARTMADYLVYTLSR
jgi:uncharacterized iron-regulated protein